MLNNENLKKVISELANMNRKQTKPNRKSLADFFLFLQTKRGKKTKTPKQSTRRKRKSKSSNDCSWMDEIQNPRFEISNNSGRKLKKKRWSVFDWKFVMQQKIVWTVQSKLDSLEMEIFFKQKKKFVMKSSRNKIEEREVKNIEEIFEINSNLLTLIPIQFVLVDSKQKKNNW